MTLPIKLKHNPVNRSQKRAIRQEMKRILPYLLEVEFSFYKRIFIEPTDYKTAYEWHLEWYKSRVEFTQLVRKPKWYELDEFYFSNLFKPEENFEA